MNHLLLALYVRQATVRAGLRSRLVGDESGEGVISAAIAVLVMAFLGVLMWALFKDTLTRANDNVNTQLDQLK